MGVVYLGFDEQERPVAVKVPAPGLASNSEFRRRFRDEVTAARRVHGSSVAAVVNFDLDAGQPWLATEYVEGKNLADAVTGRGAFTGRLLDSLAIGLVDALVAIHTAGVVHRDLKPSNILLAWDGPKAIDFGIARAGDATHHTQTGTQLGTPVWMAPEQLRGERAGMAADVFAWGACVAYAATGRPPFRGERPEAVAIQIMTGEPDLSGVPDRLAGIVRQALTKVPARRPTAMELRAKLVAAMAGHPGDGDVGHDPDQAAATMVARWWSLPPTPPEAPAPRPQRQPGRVSAPDERRAAGGFPPPPPPPTPYTSTHSAPTDPAGIPTTGPGIPLTGPAGSSPRYADGTPTGPGGFSSSYAGGTTTGLGAPPTGLGSTGRSGTPRAGMILAVMLALLLTGAAAVAVTLSLDRGSPDSDGPEVSALTTTGPSQTPTPSQPSPSPSPTSTGTPTTTSTSPTPAVSSTSPTPPSTQQLPVAKPARDGDVDGDGKADRITLTGPGQLEVIYSAGGSDQVPFGPEDPEQRVLGAVDADSDGYAEVFVQAAAGAAARRDAAFRYVDGHLQLVTTADEPAPLYRVGSLSNQGAWACQTSDAAIVQWSRTTEDGQSYSGEVRSYSFVDATLVLTSRVPFQNLTKADMPAAPGGETPAWGCGSLKLALR